MRRHGLIASNVARCESAPSPDFRLDIRSGPPRKHTPSLSHRLLPLCRGIPHPAVEDRAVEVQLLLADRGQHRAPSIPDLLIAALAEISGLTVLALDKDFELIAQITGNRSSGSISPRNQSRVSSEQGFETNSRGHRQRSSSCSRSETAYRTAVWEPNSFAAVLPTQSVNVGATTKQIEIEPNLVLRRRCHVHRRLRCAR